MGTENVLKKDGDKGNRCGRTGIPVSLTAFPDVDVRTY
jgi:hypothetical protein